MKRIYVIAAVALTASTSCQRNIDFAKECADRYPISRDTFHSVTETVLHDTIVEGGITIAFDTLLDCQSKDTVRLTTTLDCPPNKKITETRTRFDSVIIYQNDRAKETVYQHKIDSLHTTNGILRGHQKTMIWASVIGWAIIILFIIFKITKKWLTLRAQSRT